MDTKIFASSLSTAEDWREAVKEAASGLKKEIGKSCDLVLVFVSEGYDGFEPAAFVKRLADLLPYRVILGCNSSGVIGDRNEIEMEPAISLLGMHLPGVKLYPFSFSPDQTASAGSGPALIKLLDIYPNDKPRFLCLADPATADVQALLKGFNEGYKGLPVVGGLSSGAVMGSANWMCLNGNILTEGACGVALVGDVEIDVMVSQGCRPIGKPYIITRAEGNTLYELAGKPALVVIRDLVGDLTPKDRTLAENSLSVGIAVTEQKDSFKRGDFLIRNIMGFDPESGSLVIGENLRVGQTMQFQLRDAETSSEDLKAMLGTIKTAAAKAPQAGLLISCCGRGRAFYGRPDHDVAAIQAEHGPMPMAGFFANGEIGPVDGKNHIHGYTSSLAIFR